MQKKQFQVICSSVFALVLPLTALVKAQTATATLKGSVTDVNGSALSGTVVTANGSASKVSSSSFSIRRQILFLSVRGGRVGTEITACYRTHLTKVFVLWQANGQPISGK
jgi:hypothetical protein